MTPAQELTLAPGQVEMVRTWLDGGMPEVTPRLAATIVLLREHQGVLETFLMRRTATMSFMPGVFVFPGGGVEARDHAPHHRWSGPDLDDWAQCLGVEPAIALSLLTAGVRELFEEADVLLADGGDLTALRRELDAGAPLAALLAAGRLTMLTDLMRPLTRWVTPAWVPKRFDTWFFVAHLPEGAQGRVATSESTESLWYPVDSAIEDAEAGTLPLPRATLDVLRDVRSRGALDDVMETWTSPPRHQGRAERDGEGLRAWVERTVD